MVVKNIVSEADWDDIRTDIKFIYASDNIWADLKASDLLKDRLGIATMAIQFSGRLFDDEYIIKKNILKMTDDEYQTLIDRINKQKPQEPTNAIKN